MTVRNKQELIDRAAVLFPDQGDPLIMADELRSFILDLVDSLAFRTQITGAEIVAAINTNLGNTDWQQPPGMTTGITLAQALAAIQISDTPVDTHRLMITKTATQATIGLEATHAHDETRYAAASVDPVFTMAEWLAGMTSQNNMIVFPITNTLHRRGFAVPSSEPGLTDIRVVGSPFNERGSYAPPVGAADVLVEIAGQSHKTYARTADSGANTNLGVAARTFQLR